MARVPPPQPVNRVVQLASPPGTFNRTTNVGVLIQFAYDLQEYQVVGGPSWVREDRYEVAARAGREVPLAELRLMVRSLLAERFKLVAHNEQREMSAYAMVLARADKRFGPGLKKNPDGDECKRLVELDGTVLHFVRLHLAKNAFSSVLTARQDRATTTTRGCTPIPARDESVDGRSSCGRRWLYLAGWLRLDRTVVQDGLRRVCECQQRQIAGCEAIRVHAREPGGS